jgi:hypothetical protein
MSTTEITWRCDQAAGRAATQKPTLSSHQNVSLEWAPSLTQNPADFAQRSLVSPKSSDGTKELCLAEMIPGFCSANLSMENPHGFLTQMVW